MQDPIISFTFPNFEKSFLSSGSEIAELIEQEEPVRINDFCAQGQLENSINVDQQPSKEEKLHRLLSAITNENIHAEIDWGGPVGEEEW